MANKLITACFIIFLFFNCCQKKEGCIIYNQYLPLSDTSKHWFENILKDTTLTASSSKGRTESYQVHYYSGFTSWETNKCTVFNGEGRNLEYNSSLYDHSFRLQIEKNLFNDIFIIESYYDASLNCKINFSSKDRICITSYDQNAYYPKPQIQLPYSIIDTLIINNRTFFQIYKIDLQKQLYSFDNISKVLYFSSKYGLVKFETFDGETWSLY